MAALAKSSLVFFFMAQWLWLGYVLVLFTRSVTLMAGLTKATLITRLGHLTSTSLLETLSFLSTMPRRSIWYKWTIKDYKECKAKDPLFTFASGNDNVKITMPGDFFYTSSLHDHCKAGQKLHIQVHGSSSTPSPSQTPSFSSPSPSPVHLSRSPTPSASPSLSPSSSPRPSPSGSPTYSPNGSPGPSPRTISVSPPPKPSPTVRPNPPPSVPIVVSNPPPPSPRGTPPTRRKAVITKSQASPSNGLPILQVLISVVAVLAYIA